MHSKLNFVCFLMWVAAVLLSCKEANRDVNTDDPANWPATFGWGRKPTIAEIRKLDIDIMPDGTGLPDDSGRVPEGRMIYQLKCASCHGPNLVEGRYNQLVTVIAASDTSKGKRLSKAKTIGNYWPYATTLYDYINRTMPFYSPGSLNSHEVYGLTAFLLSENKIIDSNMVLNKHNLAKIVMPARDLFVPDDRKGGAEIK